MADAMTLYRFPITELAKWHEYGKTDEIHEIETPLQVNSLMSEVPPYPHDPELNDNLNFKQQEDARRLFETEYPEEKVFCLKDLQRLYENYAGHDPRIKEFVEKITEMVRVGDTDSLLHSFQINELQDTEFGTARIAVLAFNTEQNGHSYDLLVKDLEQDLLLPILILNTDGEVAFDKLAGFYYT